jgi:hypothetical protein
MSGLKPSISMNVNRARPASMKPQPNMPVRFKASTCSPGVEEEISPHHRPERPRLTQRSTGVMKISVGVQMRDGLKVHTIRAYARNMS